MLRLTSRRARKWAKCGPDMRAEVYHYDSPLTDVSLKRLHFVDRKVLVLDLDETLVYSHNASDAGKRKPLAKPDYEFRTTLTDKFHLLHFYVYKRPHLDHFLSTVSHWYEIVIFTAGIDRYCEKISDALDENRGILKRRFNRVHCTPEGGSYTKDLRLVCPDLCNVCILDNSPYSYRHYKENAIMIESWRCDNAKDHALLDLLPFLDALRFTKDVRNVLCRKRGL